MKPSPATEIRTLIDALGAADEIKRESAIARLAVIGRRAVDRLVAVYPQPTTERSKRLAILRVFEASGDPGGLATARDALKEGGDVAVAAAAALRRLLELPDADSSAEALDALIATAMDAAVERRVRVAALDALQGMPDDVRNRVAAALDGDLGGKPTKGARVGRQDSGTDALWQDALDGQLPDGPAALRQAVQVKAGSAALGLLQKLVDAVRTREGNSGTGAGAEEWRAIRGALHQALALRGSTVALYDLRETIAAADRPLPSSFVAALHAIGDETCLEPIAAAVSRSGGQERWRHQLTEAFAAIVKRERVPPGSPLMKRIGTRWPDAAPLLSTPSRTRPRRKRPVRT